MLARAAMLDPGTAGVTILALMGGAVAMWAIPDSRGCPDCPHCRREREEREHRQRALRHDLEHKGWGHRPGDRDRMRCADEACSRNAPLTDGRRSPAPPRRSPHDGPHRGRP
jgi:hypothetical protein